MAFTWVLNGERGKMNKERTTPEELAEFILKERVCRYCAWWLGTNETEIDACHNKLVKIYASKYFTPQGKFGCNQWKGKDE